MINGSSNTGNSIAIENVQKSANIFSQFLFLWLNPILAVGKKKALQMEDLYPINDDDKGERVFKMVNEIWSSEKDKSLFHCILKAFGARYFCSYIYCFIQYVTLIVGPLLLNRVIELLKQEDIDKKNGLICASLMLICNIISVICARRFLYECYSIGMNIRAALMTMIYDKSLRLSFSAKSKYGQGEISNIMETDTLRLRDPTYDMHILFFGPFLIIVSTVLVWVELGASASCIMVILVLIMVYTWRISVRAAVYQKDVMKVKDDRVNTTSEALGGMKLIKMKGWRDYFIDRIDCIRKKEIHKLKKFFMLYIQSVAAWDTAPILICSITFLVCVLTGGQLTVSKTFTVLTLFGILRGPFRSFPVAFRNLTDCKISLKRVEDYLRSEEVVRISHTSRREKGITIMNGDFSWKNSETELEIKDKVIEMKETKCFGLRNICLEVNYSSLTAIIGHVGSGKSSLFGAVLGEMHCCNKESIENVIRIRGHISYVPQSPYIINATIQDNILFGSRMDEMKYKKVLNACALQYDLQFFVAGDKTEIGERGINLSGGQRARVCLARALYQDADIYFLDDPLAAVDVKTSHILFYSAIKDYLKEKCVVLVTHAVDYISQCDHVIVMEEGKIMDEGSYEELREKKNSVLEGIMSSEQNAKSIIESEDMMDIANQVTARQNYQSFEFVSKNQMMSSIRIKSSMRNVTQLSIVRNMSTISKTRSRIGTITNNEGADAIVEDSSSENSEVDELSLKEKSKNTTIHSGSTLADETPMNGDLITIEKRMKGSTNWQVYQSYIKSLGGVCIVILIVLAFVIAQLSSVASSYFLSYWTNSEKNASDPKNAFIYLGLGILSILVAFLADYFFFSASVKSSTRLHNQLIRGIFDSPMSFFDTTPLGRITNRVSRDIYCLDNELSLTVEQFIKYLLASLFSLLVIIISSPLFLFFILLIGFYYYYVQVYYVRSNREAKRLESISKSPIFSNLNETLDGLDVIRAYNNEEERRQMNYALINENMTPYFINYSCNCWRGIRIEICGGIVVFITILLSFLNTTSPKYAALAAVAISYAMNITNSLTWTVKMTADLQSRIVSMERIEEYIQLPSEGKFHVKEKDPEGEWPQTGDIHIRGVVARYRPELPPVLNGLNVEIQSGEKIGVVGRTGAGKSSLILCLMRIIEIESGSIFIDDKNIQELGLDYLRSRIAIIPQDPVLFSGTLRSNLDPRNEYSDEMLFNTMNRIKREGNFVDLYAVINENGDNISVGERQLVCIARALLSKSRIVLLDEATASIDMETDMHIQNVLRQELKSCTMITIAHRIHSIMDSDRILVLDAGQVIEFDKPSVLIKNPHSVFLELVNESKQEE